MLQEKLTADLHAAMKAKDKGRLDVLRMAKSAIKNAEIEKQKTLDDAEVTEVLSREAKKRRESITEFRNASRHEMADKEESELTILLEYLPQQMSPEEVETLVRQVIEETGAQGPRDKGKVMPKLMPQVKGKADGKMVNEIVTQLLEAS